MTFEEYCKNYCVQNGMFPDQAASVVDVMKNDEASAPMSDRWNDDTDGYPPMMINVIIVALRNYALAWIDENIPMAWYRPMFAPVDEKI